MTLHNAFACDDLSAVSLNVSGLFLGPSDSITAFKVRFGLRPALLLSLRERLHLDLP